LETQIQAVRAKVRADLARNGFSFCQRLLPDLSSGQVANLLGAVVDLSESGISVAQTLVPRETTEAALNQYSGNYGLNEFPLHSDLAHWAIPPRYFMLRCIIGAEGVFTHVLLWSTIAKQIRESSLRRAVFTVRKHRLGYSCLVRAYSTRNGLDLLRWDPLFLRPLNAPAQEVASAITSLNWDAKIQRILLKEPGDTLLADNWQILHGRAAVSDKGTQRRIERIYLAGVRD